MQNPNFVIIGAMKCGTSTLAAQLGAQSGIFITTPKEPNFFSDDHIFAKGFSWYESLFAGASHDEITGEASTHYTKLPTHPMAAERLFARNPHAKLIYVTRDPIERLISHYIHEWTMGVITVPIEDAIHRHPELITYSQYRRQLEPWIRLFGNDQILRLTLESINDNPQETLEIAAAFIGYKSAVQWNPELGRLNASSERIKRFPLYNTIMTQPVATSLRRKMVPKYFRQQIKRHFQMQERPVLSQTTRTRLQRIFEESPT